MLGKKILLALLIALALGCSPTKRINNLFRRFPGLVVSDTEYITIEHVSRGDSFSEVLPLSMLWDAPQDFVSSGFAGTIYLKGDTVYISGKCPDDTASFKTPKAINLRPDRDLERRIRKANKRPGRWPKRIAIFIGIIIFIIATYLITRKR